MQLIARGIFGLAAALFLSLPAVAPANLSQGDPTGDYSRLGGCGPANANRAPVTTVFQGFPSKQVAIDTIGAETGWTSPSVLPIENLGLVTDGSGGTECRVNEPQARLSPLSGSRRTLMRLWGNDLVTAGTPIRQTNDTGGCAAWITAPDGFNLGRSSFNVAFQGPSPTSGPYPLINLPWGNTAPIQQCNLPSVWSDGNVTMIRPKDSFGYNDRWVQFSEDPSPTPEENQRELALDQGARVARYPLNWEVVDTSTTDPTDTTVPCPDVQGNWGVYDRAYRHLVYRDPTGPRPICDDTPPAPTTGIKPVLAALGAPAPYALWCDEGDDEDCGAGDCTATTDESEPPDPQNTIPAMVTSTAAHNAWRGFVQNVARRYPLARAIEIWNEPNLTRHYWGSCLPNPTLYERLLQKAHEGVGASGTGTPVVMAGMSPANEGEPDNRDWVNYLNAVFAADPAVPSLFNAMGLHPYRSEQDQLAEDGFAAAAVDDVDIARGLLEDHGVPLRQIWVTEVGVRSGGTLPTSVANDDIQATTMDQVYNQLRNVVPMVIVHRLVDAPPDGSEGVGYGATTRQAQTDHVPADRRPYYFSLCERRDSTGPLCVE